MNDLILKSGMVLELKNGIMGLVTTTHLGTLIGWIDGHVNRLNDSINIINIHDIYRIKNVYKITEADQILGKNLNVELLELIWTKPIVISNTEELIAWAKKNNIDVSNVTINQTITKKDSDPRVLFSYKITRRK